jgi:hypothetical protein
VQTSSLLTILFFRTLLTGSGFLRRFSITQADE